MIPEPEYILMGHHLETIAAIKEGYRLSEETGELMESPEDSLIGRLYTPDFAVKLYSWSRDLPLDSYVMVTLGSINRIDSLCKIGCPYIEHCPKGVNSKRFKRAPWLFIKHSIKSLFKDNSDEKALKKRGLEVGRCYTLGNIL